MANHSRFRFAILIVCLLGAISVVAFGFSNGWMSPMRGYVRENWVGDKLELVGPTRKASIPMDVLFYRVGRQHVFGVSQAPEGPLLRSGRLLNCRIFVLDRSGSEASYFEAPGAAAAALLAPAELADVKGYFDRKCI